jgi:predicted transcriptional regulator
MISKKRHANGENRPHKLTDIEVSEIRAKYACGRVTQRALASKYGVCQQLISRIVLRKNRVEPTFARGR